MKRFLPMLCLIITVAGVLGVVVFSEHALAFDPFGGVDNPTCEQTNIEGNESSVCSTDGSNPITGPDGAITLIANVLALITGIAAVVAIMIGGFEYIRSGGDSSKVDKAKNTILFAVIGLLVVIAARVVVAFVINAL